MGFNKPAGYFLVFALVMNILAFVKVVFGDPGVSEQTYKNMCI